MQQLLSTMPAHEVELSDSVSDSCSHDFTTESCDIDSQQSLSFIADDISVVICYYI